MQELIPELVSNTSELAQKICAKYGYKTPYEIIFKDFSGTEHELDDVLITPGNPPKLIISLRFTMWCLLYTKPIVYRHRLSAALEHMHVMHRTLSHPIKLSVAKALRKDSKEWIKTNVPQINTRIAERYLDVSYQVTVTDNISHMAFTLTGDNPSELREQCINRLSRLVFESEDLEEMHENMMDIMRAKEKKVDPSKIVISGDQQTVKTRVEY